jgi:hypothetical protein
VETKILEIFNNKLEGAFRSADDITLSKARDAWNDIGPTPNCPNVKDVMTDIKQALAKGHLAREQATLKLIEETVDSYGKILSPKLIEALIGAVEEAFPRDHYVEFAKNTKGVYTRQAPH